MALPCQTQCDRWTKIECSQVSTCALNACTPAVIHATTVGSSEMKARSHDVTEVNVHCRGLSQPEHTRTGNAGKEHRSHHRRRRNVR